MSNHVKNSTWLLLIGLESGEVS